MEAASTSETSVNFYQTTRRNKPDDRHLHTEISQTDPMFKSFLLRLPFLQRPNKKLLGMFSWDCNARCTTGVDRMVQTATSALSALKAK
jgi:hypothetical protein